jgi:hypothetical protein
MRSDGGASYGATLFLILTAAENAAQLRSRLAKVLNVPHLGRELSWQLGAGGWKMLRLRCVRWLGLAGQRFEQPSR